MNFRGPFQLKSSYDSMCKDITVKTKAFTRQILPGDQKTMLPSFIKKQYLSCEENVSEKLPREKVRLFRNIDT